MEKRQVLGGLIGLCVGDALGVPVEGKKRDTIRRNPINGMIGYGSHNQPPGTWSDDSSLTFCLADSLCDGYNLDDIGKRFVKWYRKGYWTARGEVFDVGGGTSTAIKRIEKKELPVEFCGGGGENDNGNGSLMRILPLAYYLRDKEQKEKHRIIDEVSSITHKHMRAIIGCTIYVEFAINLLKGMDKENAYINIQNTIKNSFRAGMEIKHYKNILEKRVDILHESEIRASGYVVGALEAALWCFMKGKNYRETVLMAVNLGRDTDTVAAITGGIAGIYYGLEDIPEEWINQIARKEDVFDLAEGFYECMEFKK